MLNFFPTLWFSIETVKDFAILLCHNKCFFSSYDMVLVHVHMRTFCKISLNHWTQLALISPNIIRKKKFIILSTIFILHTLFHYTLFKDKDYAFSYFLSFLGTSQYAPATVFFFFNTVLLQGLTGLFSHLESGRLGMG